MRTNYSYDGTSKWKAKLFMAAVCGPCFTILLTGSGFIMSLFSAEAYDGFKVLVWPILGSIFTAAMLGADRMGKRLNLTPQEFAAPVALSCTLCPILAFTLLWSIPG